MNRKTAILALLTFSVVCFGAAPVTIKPNDASAGLENRTSLQSATGRVSLPQGIISVDQSIVMTNTNSGLVALGQQATVRSEQLLGSYLDRAAMLVRCGIGGIDALSWRGDEVPANRPAVMPPNQVGWLFEKGSEGWLYARPNRRILPGEALPADQANFEFMRAFRGVPFTTGKVEFVVSQGHGCVVGEYVWATDGPAWNECVGEFRRIIAATPFTITIDRPLSRTYRQGTFCRGPFPNRLAFNGVTFSGQLGSVFLMQASELQFSDCTVLSPPAAQASAAAWTHVIQSSRCEFRRCNLPSGVGMSSGAEHRFIDCTISSVKAEQMQIDCIFDRCKIGWLDTAGACTGWKLTDCDFSDWFGVYDYWKCTNCRCLGLVRVRGKNCTVTGLKAVGPVIVQADYAGAPQGAATGVILEDIDAHYIELLPGTSGVIRNCSAPIICYDANTRRNWSRDGRTLP